MTMIYRSTLLTLIMLTSSVSAHIYEAIGQQFLKNYPVQDVHAVSEQDSERLTFVTPRLSDFDAYSTLIEILSTRPFQQNESILNQESFRDLNLFYHGPNKPNHALVNRLYRGKTMLGRVALAHRLATPTANIDTLKDYQQATQWFLTNTKKTESLTQLLSEFSSQEKALLSLWNKNDFLYSRTVAHEFFDGDLKKWRKSSDGVWLECRRRMSDFMIIGGPLLLASMAQIYGSLSDRAHRVIGINPQDNPLAQNGFNPYGPLQSAAQDRTIASPTRFTLSILYTAFIIYASYRWVLLKYAKIKNRYDLAQHIRARVRPLVAFHSLVSQLHAFLVQEPDLAILLPEFSVLDDYMSHTSEQHRSLISSLESGAFTSNSYLFSNIGTVLHIIPQLLALKQKLGTLFHAVGSIDAHIGLSTLYTEMEHAPVSYSFPEYRSDETPTIELTDFWHPLLNPGHTVANSATIGGITPKDWVITGANASGKTMTLKAIALNLLLGQSIGIAPSTHCSFTPFEQIITYLRVVDNLAHEKSLFMVEEDRASTLLRAAGSGKRTFCVMDEIFKSTGTQEGEAIAYGVTSALSGLPNSSALVATHFPKLTTLPRHTNEAVANYHMQVFYDTANDTYIRPYTLQPGRSHQVIALDMMRQKGFDSTILSYANDFLNRISQQSPLNG